MEKEQALVLAGMGEDQRRKLVEETLTELELSEDILETSQSRREALSEISVHSQRVISVRPTNWVTNASTEVANPLTQVSDSTIEMERQRPQVGLQPNLNFFKWTAHGASTHPRTVPSDYKLVNRKSF